MKRRMVGLTSFLVFLCLLCTSSITRADNGKVVSGTVIAIDPVQQIMRVWVTGVNYQPLIGTPDVNYVDYQLSPTTVVVNANQGVIGASRLVVGSQINMEFAGPQATIVQVTGYVNLAGLGQNQGVVNYQGLPVTSNYSVSNTGSGYNSSYYYYQSNYGNRVVSPIYVQHSVTNGSTPMVHHHHSHHATTAHPVSHPTPTHQPGMSAREHSNR